MTLHASACKPGFLPVIAYKRCTEVSLCGAGGLNKDGEDQENIEPVEPVVIFLNISESVRVPARARCVTSSSTKARLTIYFNRLKPPGPSDKLLKANSVGHVEPDRPGFTPWLNRRCRCTSTLAYDPETAAARRMRTTLAPPARRQAMARNHRGKNIRGTASPGFY